MISNKGGSTLWISSSGELKQMSVAHPPATPLAGPSHRTFPFKANGNTGFIQVDEGDLLPESRWLVLQEIQPHEVQSRLASKA